MKNLKDEMELLKEDTLQKKAYLVHGQKVMLDFDLAEKYGYAAQALEQLINDTAAVFESDFLYKLMFGIRELQ